MATSPEDVATGRDADVCPVRGGVAQTLQALAGAVIGILAGWVIQSLVLRHRAGSLHSSSLRETRFLVGTVVGVFAVGPLLTQLTGTWEIGPPLRCFRGHAPGQSRRR